MEVDILVTIVQIKFDIYQINVVKEYGIWEIKLKDKFY